MTRVIAVGRLELLLAETLSVWVGAKSEQTTPVKPEHDTFSALKAKGIPICRE